ncbi:hypothetical protein [Falsibacillus pallidus]
MVVHLRYNDHSNRFYNML